MSFGEKLLQLRKGKGISQEALAEQLNTSRQAISKWENNQGFPETEKLLLISNLFNVSLDYLLKEQTEPMAKVEQGYYVSKEMAEGFLIYERQTSKWVALGISLLMLSVVAYLTLQALMAIIVIAILVAAGVGVLVAGGMKEDCYRPLRQEVLIFDERVLNYLRMRYDTVRTKYIAVLMIGISLLFMGGVTLLLFEKGLVIIEGEVRLYYAISTLLISIGIFIFIRVISMIDAYTLLIKNEEHTNSFNFKISKRIRNKIRKL